MNDFLRDNKLVHVLINGELFLLNYSVYISDYLRFLGISQSHISTNIFECNNTIILRHELNTLKISNNTKLELVQVVGGG